MAPTDAPSPARYRIVESLGRGGMGEVCLADDLILDRQVALKFVTYPAEAGGLEQLLAEARAAAALDHPFICSIYDVSALDGRPCIAMEYVRGETLERRMRRGRVPPHDAVRLAEEVAEALDAAHRRRIIHRDLKPANVMITEDQHIKVMDFGLAARMPSGSEFEDVPPGDPRLVHVSSLRGTPAYMAPEQIRGEAIDRRLDIFSFGILLYELLCGANPFLRRSVDSTLAAILSDPVPDLRQRVPDAPPELAALLERLLAKDQAARPQSFGDVRRELRRLALDRPTVTPAPAAPAPRRPPQPSVRLAGRDVERARLLDVITQAAAGRGTLAVISGEAGIGKSRVLEEALATAAGRGCQTLAGRCTEHNGASPLTPYIEIIEQASRLMPAAMFRQAVGAAAPELARLVPELLLLFPDLPAPLELPPHLRQRFLFTNVREFLARAGAIAPLAIAIEDFQWADESTLLLTQHLAQHLSSLPVAIVVACRDAEATPQPKGAFQQILDRVRGYGRDRPTPQAIQSALHEAVGQGLACEIPLHPLGEPDVRQMLAALSHQPAPAAVAQAFYHQTRGNPFFIAELFRHLKDADRLFDPYGQWNRHLDLQAGHVPSSVKTVLERRVQQVSRPTQAVLGVAAVIGSEFEIDVLEAIADVSNDALVSALAEAEHARLVHGPSGRQDPRWRFCDPLICHAFAQPLATLRRQRLHLRIAEALERSDTVSQMRKAQVAHHLYSAGPLAKAGRTSRALVAAGDAAHEMYATHDAVHHYGRALEVLEAASPDTSDVHAVRECLADLLALLGEQAPVLSHYQTLVAAHAASGDRTGQARALRKAGTLQWQSGDRAGAMACYEHALATLDPAASPVEAAHLYQELGLAAFRKGDNRTAIDWSEKALQSAEAALSPAAAAPADRKAAAAAVAHATNTIGVALARLGELEAARERIERSVAAARDMGLLDVACRAYANLGVVYSTVEPRRAIDVSLTGLDLASKIGAASLQSYMYANLAAAYCALTERCETEGLEAAQAAAAIDRQLGQLDHLAVPLIVIAQIHQCRGELQEAERHYHEALALAEQAGEPQLLLPCYDGLGTIALDRGDRDRATTFMEQARDLCSRTGLDPDTLLLLPFLS